MVKNQFVGLSLPLGVPMLPSLLFIADCIALLKMSYISIHANT